MENLIEQSLEGQREAEVGAIVDELQNVRFSLQTINDLNDALTEYNVTSDITSFEDAVREANGKFGKHSYITHLIRHHEHMKSALALYTIDIRMQARWSC